MHSHSETLESNVTQVSSMLQNNQILSQYMLVIINSDDVTAYQKDDLLVHRHIAGPWVHWTLEAIVLVNKMLLYS